SLVIVGAPHFLSSTTLRPLGPRVTFTALARASTPRSSALRALSLNSSCLAIRASPSVAVGQRATPRDPRVMRGSGASAGSVGADDGEHVARREDEVLLPAVLDLGAAVLAVDDAVTHGDV